MKVVMGLSGGMDSATLLGKLLNEGHDVVCCSFSYGSKHGYYEQKAAFDLVRYYKEKYGDCIPLLNTYNVEDIFFKLNSALLKNTTEAIPEGHYNDKNMSKTVVPGRNLVMVSIMAGYAESIGADAVAVGVHSGDHFIYPDCRPQFVSHLNMTVLASSDGKVKVIAPLLWEDKTSILKMGLAFPIPVPYELTRTCYKMQETSCGKCGSCRERLEAFGKLGLKDPVEYEEN